LKGAAGNFGTPQEVLDLINEKQIDFGKIITHVFSFDEAFMAFKTAREMSDKRIKVLIEINETQGGIING